MLKVCFKCRERKALTEFYRHPKMADGRLGKCKECAKKDVRANRAANIEYYLDYDRARANNLNRVEARKAYSKTTSGKAAHSRSKNRWLESNRIKRSAHLILQYAVRRGDVTKGAVCSECSAGGKIHGHHEDYLKPLDVVWLCPKCHSRKHKIGADRIVSGVEISPVSGPIPF